MKKLRHLFLLTMTCWANMALATEPVVIGFDVANPPFMYERDGKAVGIYPALVDAAFRHMQQEVILQTRPWSRLLQESNKGLTGAAGIYINAARAQTYDFSAPLFVEETRIYFARSRPVNFTQISDLKGLRIGAIRGWSYGPAFDRARAARLFTVEETPSDSQNMRKLALGRLDAVLAISESGTALIKQLPQIQADSTPLAKNTTYLAFAKSAHQQTLLLRFDQALSAMKSSGEYERIINIELAR